MLLTSFDPFLYEFDRFAQRALRTAGGVQTTMPMDVIRGGDEVVLRFDLPGVDRESIDVTVDRGVLSVTAKRAEEHGENDTVLRRERLMGSFTRRVRLADTVDSGKIEAAYDDGVLAVRLPVAEKARPRKIEIQTDSKKKITA